MYKIADVRLFLCSLIRQSSLIGGANDPCRGSYMRLNAPFVQGASHNVHSLLSIIRQAMKILKILFSYTELRDIKTC